MRVSELSRRTAVAVPTIKYYLREGLLQPGTATAPNQRRYDEGHVRRLRLIRALVEVGGLSVADTKAVIEALADEERPMHALLGTAHRAIRQSGAGDEHADPEVSRARAEVERFVEQRGWRVHPASRGLETLAEVLAALRRLGRDEDVEVFAPYAEAAERIAAREVAALPGEGSRADAVERMVVGTVLFETALVALRRLAHQHHSVLRFGPARIPRAESRNN